jgi:uncharacterized repeat protein (TIGR03803 family)
VKNTAGVWQGKEIYHFTGGPEDGWYPYSRLIPDSAGNLYGTTEDGGAYGYGTVYEITP